MPVEVHQIKFYRNVATGTCKAVCTCGWVVFGDRDRVQDRAAVHPEEWQEIVAEPTEALLGPQP